MGWKHRNKASDKQNESNATVEFWKPEQQTLCQNVVINGQVMTSRKLILTKMLYNAWSMDGCLLDIEKLKNLAVEVGDLLITLYNALNAWKFIHYSHSWWPQN